MNGEKNAAESVQQRVLRLLGVLCLGTFAVHAWALNPERLPSQILVDQYGRSEGLPSDRVWVTREGPRGYLWIGTGGGLVRFDGVKFTLFNKKTHAAFKANDVRALEWTPSGDLWIGTYGGGAVLMRGDEFIPIDQENGLGGSIIYDIHRSRDGALWFGTEAGVSRFDGTEFRSFTPDDGLNARRILQIADGENGDVWFSSLTDGLSHFDGTVFTTIKDELDSPQIHMLSHDPRLGLLAATETGTVYQLTSPTSFAPVSLSVSAPIEAFLIDRDGNRWLGTYGSGLWRFTADGRTERFTLEKDAENEIILDLQEDRRGNLWVSTPKGLYAVRDTPFLALAGREGLSDTTFVITAEANGTLWVGTERDGLFRIRESGVYEQPYPELRNLSISALLAASDGTLWVGTFGQGVFAVNGTSVQHFDERHGLSGVHVFALMETRGGGVWASTDAGVDVWSGAEVFSRAPVTLDGALVRHMHLGRDGRAWLSSNLGLFEYVNKRTRRWSTAQGLASDLVIGTHEDERGVLWIANHDGGLARLDGDQLFSYGDVHGLPQLSAFAILEDRSRNLWISGAGGLLRVSRDNLDTIARGENTRLQTRVFQESDGLRSTQFVGGFQPAAWAAPDNKLWFTSTGGLIAFDPQALSKEPPVLRSFIEGVRANGKILSLQQPLQLPANLQSLEIDYSTPELTSAKTVNFRYASGEHNPVWQEVGTRRTAYFSSLPAGEGLFRVQARIGDAPFSEIDATTASLRYYRQPHWYETTWSVLAAVAVLGVFVSLMQRLLTRRARARERQLVELVDRRTEELRDALVRVEANSRIDTLTGVANRRHMEEQLASVWNMGRRSGAPVSIIMLDIDRFKQYNDALGHKAGDHCLRKIANAVKGKLLREHDMVARYGGEEFLIMLYDSDQRGAESAAKRIMECIDQLALPHPASDIADHVTVSIGCATASVGAVNDPHVLIEWADQALYSAKNAGRNRFCSYEAPSSAHGETAATSPESPDRSAD